MAEVDQDRIPNSIYGSQEIISKVFHHQIRNNNVTLFDYRRYSFLFEIAFPIIYQYQRPWSQWLYTQAPRAYGYDISQVSDKFSMERIFGFTIYICNGQSQFEINGIRGESGFTVMYETNKLLDIDCIRDTLYDRAFKLTFGQDATKYKTIESTFMVNKGQYTPLSHCFCLSEMKYRKYEIDCIKAVIRNWRFGIPYTAVCDVIPFDVTEIGCLPYRQLHESFNIHSNSTQSKKLVLFKNLLMNYHSIYDNNGKMFISKRRFIGLLRTSRDRVKGGTIIKTYNTLEKINAASMDGRYDIMVLFEDFESHINDELIDNTDWMDLVPRNKGIKHNVISEEMSNEEHISICKKSLKEDNYPCYPIKIIGDHYGTNRVKIICELGIAFSGVRFRLYQDHMVRLLVVGYCRMLMDIPSDVSNVIAMFYPNMMIVERGIDIEDIRLGYRLLLGAGSEKVDKELNKYRSMTNDELGLNENGEFCQVPWEEVN